MEKYYREAMNMIAFDSDIPKAVKEDVLNRICDWLESGESIEAGYIKTQYDYLIRIKNRNK